MSPRELGALPDRPMDPLKYRVIGAIEALMHWKEEQIYRAMRVALELGENDPLPSLEDLHARGRTIITGCGILTGQWLFIDGKPVIGFGPVITDHEPGEDTCGFAHRLRYRQSILPLELAPRGPQASSCSRSQEKAWGAPPYPAGQDADEP